MKLEVIDVADEPCVCPNAGWCERHKFTKLHAQFRLCQQRKDYRRLWDLRAPFQNEKPPEPDAQPNPQPESYKKVGLGDLAAAALKKIGFKPCRGCKERQAILNKVKIPWPTKHAPEPLLETVWVEGHGLPANDERDGRWAVGVTTAPRAQTALLTSLRSLFGAGFRDVRVFAEPGAVLPKGVAGITVNEANRGVFQNWRFALQTLRDEKPDAEFFAVMQDDVLYSKNLREFMERDLWFADDVGFISPYRSGGKTIKNRHFRRRRVKQWKSSEMYLAERQNYRDVCNMGDGLWGALTYIFPKKSVDLVLADSGLKDRQRTIDLAIHPVLARHKRRAVYYNPSLAEHIKGPSSIGHGSGLSSGGSFKGEEFDCLSLLENR